MSLSSPRQKDLNSSYCTYWQNRGLEKGPFISYLLFGQRMGERIGGIHRSNQM